MMKNTTKTAAIAAGTMLFEDWFDTIEDAVRERVRGVIETIMEEELDATLSRPRYGRRKAAGSIDDAAPIVGSRHGHRTRTLTGTFGQTEIAVPRARIKGEDGKVTEWKSKALLAYQRRTKQAEALIAGAYLSGTNTRRVRRALSAVFKGAVGKDVVSRTWRKVKQVRRFRDRLTDPVKRWKLSYEDFRNHTRWSDYETAIEDMMEETATKHAPWHLIPANKEPYGRIVAFRILADRLGKDVSLDPRPIDPALLKEAKRVLNLSASDIERASHPAKRKVKLKRNHPEI